MYIKNRSTEQIQEIDFLHHLHPFTDYKSLGKKSRIIAKAKGIVLEDTDGKKMIDGMSGLWCVNVGYGRESLAKVAYEQMCELPYYNTFFKTSTPPAAFLAEIISELTPEGLDHIFFSSSGSEANDTILRMVRRYWDIKGKSEKKVIISRTYGYHGSTVASASLGGMVSMHEQGDLPIPGIVHVLPPYYYAFGKDMSEDEFGVFAAKEIEKKILEIGQDKIAAFIGEPIQGAGGVIVPPKTYWPEVQKICKKYNILLIADEVICGFGRTGNWFGVETFSIEPDIMTIAKGVTSGYVPLSAAIVGERVAKTLIDEGGEFYHGYTYSGHPVACAVAIENIKIIKNEGLIEKVAKETGPYFLSRLKEFESHPLVGEVRGKGLIAAIELVKNKEKRELFDPVGEVGAICRDFCVENGLVMRAVRDGMCLSPSLIITKKEIDQIMDIAKYCIDETAKKIGISI